MSDEPADFDPNRVPLHAAISEAAMLVNSVDRTPPGEATDRSAELRGALRTLLRALGVDPDRDFAAAMLQDEAEADASIARGEVTAYASAEAFIAAMEQMDQPDVRGVVRRLVANLGTTVVAEIAGANPSIVGRWTRDDGPLPCADAEASMRAGLNAWLLLAETESAEVARTWLMSHNPLLGEVPPAAALGAGRLDEVVAAAKRFGHPGPSQ